jgi:hypothetical protein
MFIYKDKVENGGIQFRATKNRFSKKYILGLHQRHLNTIGEAPSKHIHSKYSGRKIGIQPTKIKSHNSCTESKNRDNKCTFKSRNRSTENQFVCAQTGQER